ncbi:MAG: T9SS type A sorting domain-containing protein [Lewinellaceae bacterium]|nr:T9SS type A sorting domain-containing protein [Lewinellaceae bacterium]
MNGEVMIGLDPLNSIAPEQSSGIIQDDQHITFPFEDLPRAGNRASACSSSCQMPPPWATPCSTCLRYEGPTPNGELSTDTFQLNRMLRCAYDPNDKLVYTELDAQGRRVEKDASIVYTIRFQNTGNAPARRVVLSDQLDEQLDRLSFRPLSASHGFDCSISEGGLLRVVFEDIQLPDSLSDPLGSQGYFQFSIGQLPATAPGDIFENTSDIYFDANPPIRTNTTVTQIPMPVGTEDGVLPGFSLKVFPNPAQDWFEFNVPADAFYPSYRIVNVWGATIAEGTISNGMVSVISRAWPPGAYTILVKGKNGHPDASVRVAITR